MLVLWFLCIRIPFLNGCCSGDTVSSLHFENLRTFSFLICMWLLFPSCLAFFRMSSSQKQFHIYSEVRTIQGLVVPYCLTQ